MSIFDINPNIQQAETLSSEFYTDEKYFQQSLEKIFSRSWHFVSTIENIANIKPFNILETPLLLTKENEVFNCISNVCTHRGAVLVEKDCEANGIRCKYHGRRFGLDGKFLSMPEFENVENFPSVKDNLQDVPFGFWENFIFASLNPCSSIDSFLYEMKQQVILPENLKLTSTKDYEVNAHWALYCENYLEGFHIPFVHQTLNEVLDYGSYTTELFKFSSLQTGFDENGEIAAKYFYIFPNMMFNFYPWGLSLNLIKPVHKEKTIVQYLTFVADESKLETGAGADLDRVEKEDQAVVESVQKGLKSRFYNRGRYSPTREQGTHHFHRLICEFMNID